MKKEITKMLFIKSKGNKTIYKQIEKVNGLTFIRAKIRITKGGFKKWK